MKNYRLRQPAACLEFDGVSSFVETPVAYDGSHAITIEVWALSIDSSVRPDVVSNTFRTGFSPTRDTDGRWVSFHPINGKWTCCLAFRDKTPDGQWAHVACVYDQRGVGRLFVDGKDQGVSDNARMEDLASEGPFTIGADPLMRDGKIWVSKLLTGTIDQVRISRIVRYREDFMPADRLEADENTIVLYHFDEGDGNIVFDSSGNGNHGKIINAKWVRIPAGR